MNSLELRNGLLSVGVLPELGGALAWFRHGTFDLLRPWDLTPTVRRTACYPLVPYSNRIAKGRFPSSGREYCLPLNFGDHPHAIHGVGWQREWQVLEHSAHFCHLRLDHDPGEDGGSDWPFAFRTEQLLNLDEHGLSMTLSLSNGSRETMPAGLGWHPYFQRRDSIELAFEADCVWTADSTSLPVEAVTVPPDWSFVSRRAVGRPGLDNCFQGWSRNAEVLWPRDGLGVFLSAAQGLEYLVVFTPPEPQTFIAIEPVSHLNNALNMPSPEDNGVVWLEPGHTMERRLRMDVSTDPSRGTP